MAITIRLFILLITKPESISSYLPEKPIDLFTAALWANGNYNGIYNVIFGDVKPIDILWFLPALYWARLIYHLVRKFTGITNSLFYLSISYTAYIISIKYINIPFGVPEGVTAIIFYHLGTELKKGLDENFYKFSIIIWILTCFSVKMDMAAYIYSLYPVNIIAGLGGTLVIIKLSSIIVNTNSFSIINYVGYNSIYFFILHALFLYVFTFVIHIDEYCSTFNTLSCVLIIALTYISKNKIWTK